MSRSKSLFLLAGYDKDGLIDDSLIHYIKSLSKIGDIILCMDCNCEKSELQKVSKYCINIIARRHCEYDFGSYKRAYIYAKDNDILKNYDFVYMVNDSVYGPLHDLQPILKTMESYDTDAFGMTESIHTKYRHIQSWFIGMKKTVFLTDWFDDFITNIKAVPDKIQVTILYENRFTTLIEEHNKTWHCPFSCPGRSVYNKPKKLFRAGCPFIKRMSFTRHNGAIGHQLYYIFKHCDKNAAKQIISGANHTYTTKYIKWLLTPNPLSCIIRGTKYLISKIQKKQS